jgi:hypothetical protein
MALDCPRYTRDRYPPGRGDAGDDRGLRPTGTASHCTANQGGVGGSSQSRRPAGTSSRGSRRSTLANPPAPFGRPMECHTNRPSPGAVRGPSCPRWRPMASKHSHPTDQRIRWSVSSWPALCSLGSVELISSHRWARQSVALSGLTATVVKGPDVGASVCVEQFIGFAAVRIWSATRASSSAPTDRETDGSGSAA